MVFLTFQDLNHFVLFRNRSYMVNTLSSNLGTRSEHLELQVIPPEVSFGTHGGPMSSSHSPDEPTSFDETDDTRPLQGTDSSPECKFLMLELLAVTDVAPETVHLPRESV